MNVDDAWNANKDRCGREMHDGWKRQKLANGFADHPFNGDQENWPCNVAGCRLGALRHHPDMIAWEALSPAQQAINYQGGEIPFRIGWQAREAPS